MLTYNQQYHQQHNKYHKYHSQHNQHNNKYPIHPITILHSLSSEHYHSTRITLDPIHPNLCKSIRNFRYIVTIIIIYLYWCPRNKDIYANIEQYNIIKATCVDSIW